MASQLEATLTNGVVEWIDGQARKLNIAVTTYPDSITRKGNWIHVHVGVNQDGNAYDRATWLQQIEDEWDPQAFDGLHLLLVPAKAEPSKAELYAQVGELMQRQHLLLERIGEEGADPATMQRFQSIRQEWEDTLEEMHKKHPHKNGVV